MSNRMLSILLIVLLILSFIPPISAGAPQYKQPENKQLTYPIAIIGDYPRNTDGEGDIYTLLINNGFSSSDIMQYDSASSFLSDLLSGQLYSVVIFNRWSSSSGPASADELLSFIQAIDIRDIPLLILDAGYTSYTGGDAFYDYKDDLTAAGYPAPLDYIQHYPGPDYVLVDPVDATHPIFNGVPDPYYLGDPSSSYIDYITYPDFSLSVVRLAWLNDTQNSVEGYAIAEWTASGGESWIFMPCGGSGYWVRYTEMASDGQYSSDQATVFINTVNYLVTTGNPHQPPKGVVYGYVFDADTGDPIPNAIVYAGAVSNTTNASGYYELHLEEGTYNVTAEAITHRPQTVEITVTAASRIEQNFTLTRKPKADIYVAIVGDYADYSGYGKDLYNYLSWNYSAVYYTDFYDFLSHKDDYSWDVIVLQWLGSSDPDINDFIDFLKWADSNNIPLIILDEWWLGRPAGYYMYNYRSDIDSAGYVAPSGRTESSDDTTNVDIVVVNTTHPLFNGVPSTYKITNYSTTYYAYYSGFTKPVYELADLYLSGSRAGIAIAEWKAPQNESWIFISYATNIKHHYNVSDTYGFYTNEAKKVLVNAIDYAASTKRPPVFVKLYGYVKDQVDNPLPGVKVELLEAGLVNYTDSNGYYEFNGLPGDKVYSLRATKLGYYIYEETVHLGYVDTEYNITMKSKPASIVVVGDKETNDGKLDLNLTLSPWWNIEEVDNWQELIDVVEYEGNILAVIINAWGTPDPSDENVTYVLNLLDSNNIPIIFLQGGQSYPNGYAGIYQLYRSRYALWSLGYPAPENYEYHYPDGQYLFMKMLDPTHVLFTNIAPDEDQQFYIMRLMSNDADYHGYTWPSENLSVMDVIGLLNDTYNNLNFTGIAIWSAPGGEKWVFLGHGGSTGYARYTEEGSYNQYSYKMIYLLNNTINYVLGMTPPILTGKLYGYVTDEYSNPIPNAMVRIVELGLVNYTDGSGYYEFNNIPSGTYTIIVEKFGYRTFEATITVGAGVNVYNIILKEAASEVIIVGDYNNDLHDVLTGEGLTVYSVDDYNELLNLLCTQPEKIGVVVFNSWGTSVDADTVVHVLQLLDVYNIPVVFLDSWGTSYYHGGYYLYLYHDEITTAGYAAPSYREDYYTSNVSISMNISSPLFNDITPDFDNAFYVGADVSGTKDTDYAYYEFDPGSGVTVLGYLLVDGDPVGASVAEWTADGGEKWIFLSASASYYWMKYSEAGEDNQYSAKALQLLINAIVYANSTRGITPSKIIVDISVIDSVNLSSIENAEILVNETGDVFHTGIDGTVSLVLPIYCGNYTLIISRSGYVSAIYTIYGYFNKSYTILLNQYGNATITGVVYDASTGLPVEGATVEIPGINSTVTGPDGRYTLIIPAGRWTLRVSKTLYQTYTTTIVAPANETIVIDVYLHLQPPAIAIVGGVDYYDRYDIGDYLSSLGYNVINFRDWEDLYNNLSNYRISLVIMDKIGSPSAENLTNLLRELDSRNIPIIFLDTWGSTRAGYYLYSYRDELMAAGYPAPISRDYHYPIGQYVYVKVLYPEHPIFSNVSYDADNYYYFVEDLTGYADYAVYTFPVMANLTIYANIIDESNDVEGAAIAVWIAPGGERWVFISYGSCYWVDYYYTGYDNQFSDNAKQVFLNVIEYANSTFGIVNGRVAITVKDYNTNESISDALVSIPELGLSAYTNASGVAVFEIPPGTYAVYVNKSGYLNLSLTISSAEYLTLYYTVYLAPYATLTGYVLDAESGEPIANATITVVTPIKNIITYSSSDGRYTVDVIAGAPFNITVSHPLYHQKIISGIVLSPHKVKVLNITMKKLSIIILIGDESDHDMKLYLESLGYYVEVYDNLTKVVSRINTGVEVITVIFNYLSSIPPEDEFMNLIHTIDEKNISIIILDTWAYSIGTGGNTFYHYKDTLLAEGYPAPSSRSNDWTSSVENVKYVIKIPLYKFTHDLSYTETIIADPTASEIDYAYYSFPDTVLVDVVATIKYHDSEIGAGIAVWYAPGGERWIFMGAGSNYYNHYYTSTYYGSFSDNAKDLLARAIIYASMRKPKIDVFNVTVKYYRIMGPGDEIVVSGYAYIRSGNDRIPLSNSEIAVYALSEPILIGTLPTGPDGLFNGSLTVPAEVGGGAGIHTLGIGDPANQYEPSIVLPLGGHLILTPAPELPILPILLLATILLFIILKKRK